MLLHLSIIHYLHLFILTKHREYCYKASVINAGNRITPQVALESLYEINKIPSITNGYTESYVYGKTYMPPIMRKTDYAPLVRRTKNLNNKKRDKKDNSRSLDKISKAVDSPYNSTIITNNEYSDSLLSLSTSDLDPSSSFASSTIDSVSTFKGFTPGTSSLFKTNDYDANLEVPTSAIVARVNKKKQRKWALYRYV